MDASKIPGCAPDKRGKLGAYLCKSVPKPHPDIETYVLLSSKDTGVCKITGLGTSIADNGAGAKTQQRTDEIAAQIATSYGQFTDKVDFLHSGAMFKDKEYWLMAVEKGERTYEYGWVGGKFASKNNVEAIVVMAKASRCDVGYVFVQFDFSNIGLCLESIKKAQGGVF